MPEKKKAPKPNVAAMGATAEQATVLSQQLGAGERLAAEQTAPIEDLQRRLAAGEITQEEFDSEIGGLFDERLALLSEQLEAQGKERLAAEARGQAAQEPTTVGQTTPEEFAAAQRQAGGGIISPVSRFRPSGEDEEILFGGVRPEEEAAAPAFVRGRVAPPADLYTWLPFLLEAALAPDAPPQLRVLLEMLNYHLSRR